MRRSLALAALALLAPAVAPPVAAHVPARLVIVEPAEGAVVSGGTVRVVVAGEGGLAPAAFRLEIDGQVVDATGRIGGVFSTLSVAPNDRLTVEVPVAPGPHTLRAIPNADPDMPGQETAVRSFTAVRGEEGGAVPAAVLAGIAVVVAVGTALVVRRRAAGLTRSGP